MSKTSKQIGTLQSAQADNQTFVNNADLTQQDINYSVKIGKQVIQAKLKEAKEANHKKRNKIRKIVHTLMDEKTTEALLRKEFKETVINAPKITALRTAWNMFHAKKIRTNWGLISADRISRAVNLITRPNSYDEKRYGKLLSTKLIDIDYYMHIGMRDLTNMDRYYDQDDSVGESETDCGYILLLDLPPKLLSEMTVMLKHLKAISTLDAVDTEINDKLKNINDTMEKMEAKLLTNELNRSNRGQQVLDVASSIITDVLGENINLALEAD